MWLKIVSAVLSVLLILSVLALLLSSQREALREARDQAAIRAIAEFNFRIMRGQQIDTTSYLKELSDFQKSKEELHLLDLYVRFTEECLKTEGTKKVP